MTHRREPPYFREDSVADLHRKLVFCDIMELFIETLTGTCFQLRVFRYETVLSVKAKIHRLEGIPIGQQHLIWKDIELEDECCLHDYSISDGCTLRLVLAMRGGPINTRRVPAEDPDREPVEYRKGDQDEVWDRPPPSKQLAFLVYHEGDQVNFFRVVDRGNGTLTPVSESVSAGSVYNLYTEEEDEGTKAGSHSQHMLENSITMHKMKQLKIKMENMNINKKPKKTIKLKPRPPSGLRPCGGSIGSVRQPRMFHVLPQIGQSLSPVTDSSPNSSSYYLLQEEETWECPTLSRMRVPPKVSRLEIGGPRLLKECTFPAVPILSAVEEAEPQSGGVSLVEDSQGSLSLDLAVVAEPTTCKTDPPKLPSRLAAVSPPLDHPLLKSQTPQSHASHIRRYYTDPLDKNARLAADLLSSAEVRLGRLQEQLGKLCGQHTAGISNMPASDSSLWGSSSRTGWRMEVPTCSLPPVKPQATTKKKSFKYCFLCGKKTGLATSYECRCGNNFCASHRYAEAHDCSYDYKGAGRRLLQESNPIVSAPKLPKI